MFDSSTFFQIRTTLANKRSELYPGTYTLAAGMSYGDAIDALSTAPVKRTIVVTIPEGLGREEVADVVADAGVTGDYLKATEGVKEFAASKYGAPKGSDLEGFLFPATYELPARATVNDLVERQLDAFNQRIGAVDLSYARSKNLNVYDVLKIASMVEREVQVPEERPLVAAVIYNRLKKDIPLGIDATIRFALDKLQRAAHRRRPGAPVGLQHPHQPGAPSEPDRQPRGVLDRGRRPTGEGSRTCTSSSSRTPAESTPSASATTSSTQNSDAYQAALEKEGGAPTRC